MSRFDQWERKLLGNLAGRVRIDSDERDLLVRSAEWHRQKHRESDDAYESRIHDNFPDWIGYAFEVEERILHRAGIDRKGNPIAATGASSLMEHV